MCWTNGQSVPSRQEARQDQGQMSEEEKLRSSQEIVGQEGITGLTLTHIREHLIRRLDHKNVGYIWPEVRGVQTKSGNKKSCLITLTRHTVLFCEIAIIVT